MKIKSIVKKKKVKQRILPEIVSDEHTSIMADVVLFLKVMLEMGVLCYAVILGGFPCGAC